MDTKKATELMSNGAFINGIIDYVNKLEKKSSNLSKEKTWRAQTTKQRIRTQKTTIKQKKAVKGK